MAPPLTSTVRLSRSTDGSPQPPDQQNSSMGAAILPALCPGSTSPRASVRPRAAPPARPAPRATRGGGRSELRGEAGRRGVEPRASGEGGRRRLQRRVPKGGRVLGRALLAEAGRPGCGEPRTPEGAAGPGEAGLVLPGRLWGFSQPCTRPGLRQGPAGLGPEQGPRGGPPSRMFSTARYVWSRPRAACRHGNKTGAAAAEAGSGWGLGGGRRWGSRAVAVVTGTEAPLRFIRVTACPPVPPVFPVWPRPLACPLVYAWPCWPFPRS